MSMSEIQSKLKAPKGQFNSFGKYNYRSCEDIVEAVKPVLKEYGYHLNMSDDVIGVGDRVYIKATCIVMHGDKEIAKSTALAREAEDKKGMDDSQITGTASSYARKYALNGLFAIDDTKDADTGIHPKEGKKTSPAPNLVPPKLSQQEVDDCIAAMNGCDNLEALQGIFGGAYKRADKQQQATLTGVYNAKKSLVEKAA